MKKLLILAFLLYDVVTTAIRSSNYDYDDMDGSKRHSIKDDRRQWRKKVLSKPSVDEREWDRKRYESDAARYIEDMDSKNFNGIDRQRELDFSSGYRSHRYEDEKAVPSVMKSSEIHLSSDKEMEKKPPPGIICEKQHERYESCFAGCASVSCDNPRDRMQACYPFCEAGCICVPPYVRDDRTHKCVLPEDCTKGLKGVPDLGDDIPA